MIEEQLWRYRQNAFTDDDVTGCTGLTVRAWRELIKLRAVHTLAETRGRGRVRLCDASVFKRAQERSLSASSAASSPLETNRSAEADPKTDWLIDIYDNRSMMPFGGKRILIGSMIS